MVSTAQGKNWPADDLGISYEGRIAVGAEHQVRMGYPGITARVHVDATVVRARISASSDDVYFNLRVDGDRPRRIRLTKGINEVELLRADQPALHDVELVKRTESWQGVCDVLGFTVEGGTLLPPAALPARKTLFIGDSITCGERTDAPDDPSRPGAECSNAAASYGFKLAKRLRAQVHLVGYGGRGVFRDWQGIRDTNNAPVYYGLALPDDPGSPWNPRRYVPDVIGICLGTNDFSQGIPDENEFVRAYVEFLRRLASDAPNASIILVDSPILTDCEVPKKTACRAYLDMVVSTVNRPNVSRAWVKHYEGAPGDGHPVAAEHTLLADELEPAFRRVSGWLAD
jgi:hypothetical protein